MNHALRVGSCVLCSVLLLCCAGCEKVSQARGPGGGAISQVDVSEWTPALKAIRATQTGDLEMLKTLVGEDAQIANAWDEASGMSLLHYAAQGDNTGIVQFLLDHGADTLVLDFEERTPLTAGEEARAPKKLLTLLLNAQTAQEQKEQEPKP